MQVKIKLPDGKIRNLNVTKNSTIEDVLKKLKINTETVIVKRNNCITPVEEKIRDNDKIEIINVVSGG